MLPASLVPTSPTPTPPCTIVETLHATTGVEAKAAGRWQWHQSKASGRQHQAKAMAVEESIQVDVVALSSRWVVGRHGWLEIGSLGMLPLKLVGILVPAEDLWYMSRRGSNSSGARTCDHAHHYYWGWWLSWGLWRNLFHSLMRNLRQSPQDLQYISFLFLSPLVSIFWFRFWVKQVGWWDG